MNIYDFTVTDNHGKEVSLDQYKGKVLLVVNTATQCGLTPQYSGLEELTKALEGKPFIVLDFPCNQFLEQAPGSMEEIDHFCTLNYHTTFPRFSKVNVNGPDTAPLFKWLKKEAPKPIETPDTIAFDQKVRQYTPDYVPGDITWNFGKFLIDKQGNVVKRYAPAYLPKDIQKDIEALL